MDHQNSIASSTDVLVFKGYPGVGKSTLSLQVARALRAPRLDKDDVKDALHASGLLRDEHSNRLAKEVLCKLVARQVECGVCEVLVDAPFGYAADMQALCAALQPVARSSSRRVYVWVLDCVLKDESEWRRRVEERARRMESAGQHRPLTWAALRTCVDRYGPAVHYTDAWRGNAWHSLSEHLYVRTVQVDMERAKCCEVVQLLRGEVPSLDH
ncbi:hypothetical protein CDCA_CDCA03G1144 [Cyanidium caldarium]|uniref:Uncharacterized protein n=1 Tax=Cyanidium caldarium TaxID=2771 RepID=A0AAV9IS92_CYACA|nr:hypothetical protein CDCA_CDCA03G1144 [Cyanidium caldarium]|eukprot:ctg_254.g104